MGNHAIPVKVLSVIQGTGQHTEGLAVGLKVLRERARRKGGRKK